MASERQIAANRRNAKKSTGPRSAAGKKRSGKNALRHGLTTPLSGTEFMREVDVRARQIAGERTDRIAMEQARSAAEADLELARQRQFKTDLIEGLVPLASLPVPEDLCAAVRVMRQLANGQIRNRPSEFGVPPSADRADQTAEAVRRALPELSRLVRYETRATARRDRAIRSLFEKHDLN
jgi:hypothetical protein